MQFFWSSWKVVFWSSWKVVISIKNWLRVNPNILIKNRKYSNFFMLRLFIPKQKNRRPVTACFLFEQHDFFTNSYFYFFIIKKNVGMYNKRIATALHIAFTNLLSVNHFLTISPYLANSSLCNYFLIIQFLAFLKGKGNLWHSV